MTVLSFAGSRMLAAGLMLLTFAQAALAQIGMTDWRGGPMPVTLVYPTAATARTVTSGPFTLVVAPDAPPREGRHRLVVISHGTGGSAFADHALAARLAQAGFVVAQPLHEGDNFRDQRLAGPDSFRRRPAEVTRLIDALARDPAWSGRLVLDKVGVHGMSAGGVTGIALAGGRWRMLNLVRHCQQHATDDEGFCFQGARDGTARAGRQAAYERARGVPELFLPGDLTGWHGGAAEQPDPRPDRRVAAVSLAVPLAVIFSRESLAAIRIPVGVVSADRDEVLVPRFHSEHLLQHCTTCSRLAGLPGAGHFDVLWPWPDSVAREVAAQQVRGGLPQPGFDPQAREAAHARIVAFHRQHLLPLP